MSAIGRVVCEREGCDQTFTRKADMKRHVENQHQHGKLDCQHCGRAFRKDKLKTHLQNCLSKSVYISFTYGANYIGGDTRNRRSVDAQMDRSYATTGRPLLRDGSNTGHQFTSQGDFAPDCFSIQPFWPSDNFIGREFVSCYNDTALNDNTEDALTYMETLERGFVSVQNMIVELGDLPAREILEFDWVGLETQADPVRYCVRSPQDHTLGEVGAMDEKEAQ